MSLRAVILSWVPTEEPALQRSPNSGPSSTSCTFLLPRQAAPYSSGWGSISLHPSPHLVFFSAKTHPSPSTQTWRPAGPMSSTLLQTPALHLWTRPADVLMVSSWLYFPSIKTFSRTGLALLTWVLSLSSSLAQAGAS